jgi:hypothetical protein
MNCERTNPHPARVGCAGGKSIRRARRCAHRKLVAIALEVVPLKPKVVAHAKNVVPLVSDAVANATATPPLGFMLSRICARWSRTIQRKDRSRFLGTRCGPRLSRFRQMVTRRHPRTVLSRRVRARFDPRWATFVEGDRSRTVRARSSVAGGRDRIEGGRHRIEWGCCRTEWGRDRTKCGRDCRKCGRYRIECRGDHIGGRRDCSGCPPVRPTARATDRPLGWTPLETIGQISTAVDPGDPRSMYR